MTQPLRKPEISRGDLEVRESQSFDIGGRHLAATVVGNGAVTVILETGLGAEAHEWRTVQARLSGRARVLRYDRANRGLSKPAPGPRNAVAMLDDLDALLAATGLAGPFLLVGQSFGGLLMRIFAQRHRGNVCGLVLVDALQRDQFDVFGPLFPPPFEGEPPALAGFRAFWTGGWRDPRSTIEQIDMPGCLAQDAAAGDLGELPVEILTAGETFLNNPQVPPPIQLMLQSRWEELQRRFLTLSTHASITMIEGAGHFIQRDKPEAVVAAVCRIVDFETGLAAITDRPDRATRALGGTDG